MYLGRQCRIKLRNSLVNFSLPHILIPIQTHFNGEFLFILERSKNKYFFIVFWIRVTIKDGANEKDIYDRKETIGTRYVHKLKPLEWDDKIKNGNYVYTHE